MGVCGACGLNFGGWANECCIIHDARWNSMYEGTQSMTLDEVDNELLNCLLYKASTGPVPFLQRLQAYTMYGIAHAYGLIRWRGPR